MADRASQAETDFPGGVDALQGVSAVLARQSAMAGAVRHLSHGSRLFRVPQGWQAKVLADAPGSVACETLRELDTAMQDETKRVIFLPRHAMMTGDDIEKVCRRHGATKTLFWEETGV